MEKYDLIIVGAGPAGIFTAVELLRHGSKKKMLLVEKGKPVEKRHCPKAEVGHCVNCRPTCAITTGFSGAGAFSDGKLSLSYEVGGDLPTLIGEEFAQELIDYTDKIYLEFGADPHVEGIYTGEDIKEIRKNAIHAGLKLVDCPIRHLGTEKAQELYLAIQNYLADNGVEMRFNTECENIILEEEGCKGVLLKDGDDLLPVYADEVVIGTGRRGADWLEKLCAEHHIAHKPGTVDIGVRVELPAEVFAPITDELYAALQGKHVCVVRSHTDSSGNVTTAELSATLGGTKGNYVLTFQTDKASAFAIVSYETVSSGYYYGGSGTADSGKTDSANTADDSQMVIWLGSAVMAAAAVVVLTRKQKRVSK